MKVSCIQMSAAAEGKKSAIDKAVERIRQCRGSDLIVLPELWNIGFLGFDRYAAEAEAENGETLAVMKEMARETGAHLHTGSFIVNVGDNYYNTCCLLSPDGEVLGSYRKIHLFSYNSPEKKLLTPGNHVSVISTPLGNFGLAICFDLRFPELFRKMVDKEADIFLICSAWPYPRLEHWLLFNRVRAVENQAIVISANACGESRGVVFAGHSMIVDPWGIAVAACGDGEAIVSARIDAKIVHDARKQYPGLSSRTPWL